MNRILAIVPQDFTLGFKLTGIDTQRCALPEEAKEYLSKELNLIRLDLLNDDIIVQELNQNEALEELEELKLDLRGK